MGSGGCSGAGLAAAATIFTIVTALASAPSSVHGARTLYVYPVGALLAPNISCLIH
ncbi:hypothetical protein DSM21852_17710 [Methylocystis bryophila]|nr:hypothetical protein DSM21852_17710 [Methylocystis bryophila]